MANETAWIQCKEITGIINRLNNNIRHIARDIDKLKSMKEDILDNAELRAELKKVIDVHYDATMESLVADYQRFQALRDWLAENNYI